MEGDLWAELRRIAGLGPERADAVGVFAFRMPWPIVDEYLWRLLGRHGLLSDDESSIRTYDRRRRAFEKHWRLLVSEQVDDANQVAATLYLWACEAERFGFTYDLDAERTCLMQHQGTSLGLG